MRAAIMRRINILLKLLVSLVFVALSSASAAAQARPYTPDKGSAERKAITDALRVPVQKKLKQEVIFKVDHLQVPEWLGVFVGGAAEA
jgi:hypothetical protein